MRGFVRARMRPGITYAATNTAVILVAPQPDLSPDIPSLVRLVGTARAAGIGVIYAPMGQAAADGPVSPSQQAINDAGLLRPGSPGAAVHPGLIVAEDDTVLEPFRGMSAFTNPALAATLADAGLDRVIIAGSRTDIEVDSTARDALEAGLHTTVISNCCTGSSRTGHLAAVTTTLPRLVHAVLTLDDIARLLQ